jgi:hypothetical protein
MNFESVWNETAVSTVIYFHVLSYLSPYIPSFLSILHYPSNRIEQLRTNDVMSTAEFAVRRINSLSKMFLLIKATLHFCQTFYFLCLNI